MKLRNKVIKRIDFSFKIFTHKKRPHYAVFFLLKAYALPSAAAA